MIGKLIIQGKAWGEFESAKRSKGNIEISGYRSYGGTHTVRMVDQPQLNENQQMMSEAGLIGVIYSQLLEEFGFGYIEKDLWMIAENLSEKIANDQPQLNENQQIAINNAKKSFEKGADIYDCAIDMMLYDGLTDKEWAKATVAFLLWAQEQEEE